MVNLNAYDTIKQKIDKTKTWINVEKHLLLSREIKFHKYYILTKRYDIKSSSYEYFIILLNTKPNDRISYNTRLDDYGRVKIKLNELYTSSDLKYLKEDTNINIKLIEEDDDGSVYQLDI